MTSNSKNLREPIPSAGPRTPLAAVLLVNADGVIREAGPDVDALFRCTAAWVQGRALVDVVPFWGNGETEGWCPREDGSRFFGMIAALPDAPQSDAPGSEVQTRSFCIVDITSRHERAEVERHASESKFQAVLNASVDGILTIDEEGKIASFNQTAATMFRQVDNTLRGLHWRTLLDVPGDTLPASGTLFEVTARRGPGVTFVMECGFAEIVVGDERQVIVVARDVTQRRALERQVLDVSEQLQRQIGQDLHDGLGQLLTGTAFLAKSLQRSVAPEYQTQALRVVELVNQAIDRVRILARGLSPIHVEAQTLEAVLRNVVNESRELLGIRCALFHDLNVDSAHPATISQLCLITREAITNAVRHGQAARVDVRLRQEGGHALLEIEDDGVGINTDEAAEEGLGIRSMRYRARIIGGNLSITRTETGTLVRCAWTE